ncbi:MAG: hypothetical protein ACKV0T_06405, partial [Planctomycetales bacterium]
GGLSVATSIDVSPVDGLITFEEFAAYALDRGSAPLSLQSVGTGNNGIGQLGAGSAASAPLMKRLDVDGNGRLSAEEFRAGPSSLGGVDFDDDDAISPSELLPRAVSFGFVNPAMPRQVSRPAQFVELAPGASEALARKVLDVYDHAPHSASGDRAVSGSGNDRLSRDEFRVAPELFTRLDADGDGELDFVELQELARDAGAVGLECVLRIGPPVPGQSPVEVALRDTSLHGELHLTPHGVATVFVAGSQLEIIAQPFAGVPQVRMFFQQQFQAADGDNNKYLDKKESQRYFLFNQTFDAMDADDDGKLFEDEVLAYVARREAAAQARTLMNVSDTGRNLFEVLDANRDGRLSRRELLTAPARYQAWDADRDGSLSEEEIPNHFQISFGPGQPEIPGLPMMSFLSAPPRGFGPPGPLTGPAWFQKMDKNHDGDVTRREFLGSRDAFDRLDANRDGVISPEEAR